VTFFDAKIATVPDFAILRFFSVRNMIKDKKHTWNTLTNNPAILLKYKRISNNVRNQTRNLQKRTNRQIDNAL